MIKSKISIERQINDRQYQFMVPFEAPLPELLMIIDDVRKYVVERISEADKSQEDQEKQI